MRVSDVVTALLMLALSAAVFLETRGLEFYGEVTPGPAFVPVWLAAAGVVLGVLRLLEARRLSLEQAGVEWPDRPGLKRVILTFGGLVTIPLVAPVLGLFVAIVLFMGFLLIAVLHQRIAPSLVTIAITGGVVYGIFVLWLGVALPKGLLGI